MVKAVRYNKSNYVFRGYFKKPVFLQLLQIGVRYQGYRFYLPVSKKEEASGLIPIDFVEEGMDWMYYGSRNEEAIRQALFYRQDANGIYHYILDPEQPFPVLRKVKDVPYFYMNYARISYFGETLSRPLYIEDYLRTTDLCLQNPELKALTDSPKEGLCIHHVVNRMGLLLYSQSKNN